MYACEFALLGGPICCGCLTAIVADATAALQMGSFSKAWRIRQLSCVLSSCNDTQSKLTRLTVPLSQPA